MTKEKKRGGFLLYAGIALIVLIVTNWIIRIFDIRVARWIGMATLVFIGVYATFQLRQFFNPNKKASRNKLFSQFIVGLGIFLIIAGIFFRLRFLGVLILIWLGAGFLGSGLILLWQATQKK